MAFTVYKSSAGSGKTFTLVKEYLRIVLSNPADFRHVLAITFTNKAANEMKVRIVNALTEIVRYDKDTIPKGIQLVMGQLNEESGLSQELLIKNAKKVLQHVLHDYSEFAISTIDSFVHRIIRSFAFDLHVPMNFEVEINAEELLQKAVDMLISEVGNNELLTRFLVQFIQSKMDEDKSWNIELDLLAHSKALLKEDDQVYIEQLQSLTLEDFLKIEKLTSRSITSYESILSEIGKKAVTLIQKNGISNSDFYRGAAGIGKYFENLSAKRMKSSSPNSYVVQTIQDNKWHSAKAGAAEKNAIDSIKNELIIYYQEAISLIDKQESAYILNVEIRKNIYPIAILSHIDRLLQAYKKDNDVLLIAEFNRIISKVVLNEPIPFIYERVGEKYHHYLLDEFQDTSIQQWQNLLPLIDNALASGYNNLIVGDGKQAIYRWRSGEVEQFVRLPEIYKLQDDLISSERQEALKRNYIGEVLKSNYRSKPEIVNFNNSFFEFAGTKLGEKFSEMYRDVKQLLGSENTGGFVQLEFYKASDGAVDLNTFNLERTTAIINELTETGYEFGHIAVLVRGNKDGAQVAAHLLENGIPVISSESLLLEHSDKVRLLIVLLRFVYRPEDAIARLEILTWLVNNNRVNAPIHDLILEFGLSGENHNEDKSLKKFNVSLEKIGISLNREFLRSGHLIDTLESLIRSFVLMPKPDAYVQFFLDAVLTESAKREFVLADLLDWWELRKEKLSIVVPEGVSAVQVMTIHKAKGLEFPVVIYPFANEKMKPSKSKLWVDLPENILPGLKTALLNTSLELLKTPYADLYEEEIEKSKLDLINLAYVAFTRPSECLFVISSDSNSKSSVLSVPLLLKEYLGSLALYNSDQSIYTFGSILKPNIKEKLLADQYPLTEIISSDWRDKLQLSLQAPEHWDVSETDTSRQWGNLIHRILADIKSNKDIGKIVDFYVNQGILERDSKKEVLERLMDFLNQKEIAPFFKENIRVMNETEILMPDGSIYRPDKVVIDDTGITVVDYKTGAKHKSHITQVKSYMEILLEMGYQNVKGAVLYLNETSHEYIN